MALFQVLTRRNRKSSGCDRIHRPIGLAPRARYHAAATLGLKERGEVTCEDDEPVGQIVRAGVSQRPHLSNSQSIPTLPASTPASTSTSTSTSTHIPYPYPNSLNDLSHSFSRLARLPHSHSHSHSHTHSHLYRSSPDYHRLLKRAAELQVPDPHSKIDAWLEMDRWSRDDTPGLIGFVEHLVSSSSSSSPLASDQGVMDPLTQLVPTFLQLRIIRSLPDHTSFLTYTRRLLGWIESGGYGPAEQTDLVASLLQRSIGLGLGRMVGDLGERYFWVHYRRVLTGSGSGTPANDSSKGTTTTTTTTTTMVKERRKGTYDPLFLTLHSSLSSRHPSSRLTPASQLRSLLGRCILRMNADSPSQLGWVHLKIITSNHLGGRGRQGVGRWVKMDLPHWDEARAGEWMRDVRKFARRDDRWRYALTVFTEGTSRSEPDKLGEEPDLRQAGRESIFFSALRDDRFERIDNRLKGLMRFWKEQERADIARFPTDREPGGNLRKGTRGSEAGEDFIRATVREIHSIWTALALAKSRQDHQALIRLIELARSLSSRAQGEEITTLYPRTARKLKEIQKDAWLTLLTVIARATRLAPHDWSEIAGNVPPELLGRAKVMNVLLEGYTRRGMVDQGLDVWNRLVRQGQVGPAALVFVAQMRMEEMGLEHGLRFVDDWAWRADETSGTNTHTHTNKVRLETISVNMIMMSLGRAGRPDLVQWVWERMRSRWGVEPDDGSLSELILAVHGAQQQRAYGSGRRSSLRGGDTCERNPETMEYTPRGELSWQSAASIFRSTALDLYGQLSDVQNPMEEGRVLGAFRDYVHPPPPNHPGAGTMTTMPTSTLPETITYPRIKLTPHSFHAYIVLLLGQRLYTETTLAFGWMKALGIKPLKKTMLHSLRMLADSGSPKDLRYLKEQHGWGKCSLMGPDEWLRYWFVQWLGESKAPSEQEVAESVRERMRALGRDQSGGERADDM